MRPSHVAGYEAWARELHATLARQPGFVGVHVLRGQSGATPEYVTLLRFASPQALAAWRASPKYAAALQKLPQFTAGEVDYRESVGLEAWFDRPAHSAPPPLWWAAILPSALLATIFLNWPVLPLLSRLLRGWLYPARPQR